MRPGLWWNWLLRRVFNYLQSFRRGVWCNSLGGEVDRSAIDSLHTERPDPCNYFLVPSERLRYVRQAKALLSIISFILRKKKKKFRECINVKDFLNRLCVVYDIQSSVENTGDACLRCHLHWHAIPYTLRHHKRDFSLAFCVWRLSFFHVLVPQAVSVSNSRLFSIHFVSRLLSRSVSNRRDV